MTSRDKRIRYTRRAGTVVAVVGALSTAFSATTFDVQAIGWGATIIIGGLLLRQNANAQELNERLLETNDELLERNSALHKENTKLRQENLQLQHSYDRRE